MKTVNVFMENYVVLQLIHNDNMNTSLIS